MCKVAWCKKEPLKYKNGNPKAYCAEHVQYKKWVKNAPTRPWLMYKLEKILIGDLKCEICGVDKVKQHGARRPLKQIVSLFDVDHIISNLKGTPEGEMPNNYQLLCTDCHKFKSYDDGDHTNKKYR